LVLVVTGSTIQTWLVQKYHRSIAGTKFRAHVNVVFTIGSIEIPIGGRAIAEIAVGFARVHAFSPIQASIIHAK
jgi:hypothetical protein